MEEELEKILDISNRQHLNIERSGYYEIDTTVINHLSATRDGKAGRLELEIILE